MTPEQRAAVIALVQWATGCDDVQWENEPNNYNDDRSVTLGIATVRYEARLERRVGESSVSYRRVEVAQIDGQVQVHTGVPCEASEIAGLAAVRLASGTERQPIVDALALGVDVRDVAPLANVRGLATNHAVIDTAVFYMEVAFGVADVDTSAAARYTIEQVSGLEGTYARPDGSTLTTLDTIPETLGD